MSENQAEHAVSTMCRALGVTEAGYYAWRGRPASKRAEEDTHLSKHIHAIHQMSDGTYGAPRARAELVDTHGLQVGRRRVASLMREARLAGVSRRGYCVTTKRDDAAQSAANLVGRRFEARRPTELWVAGITYIPTWAGSLYLAVVIDVWSRMVVGWAIATHLKSELVIAALNTHLCSFQPGGVATTA
nr:IS3 family transposase [Myxococcus sp. MH1]